MTVPAVRPEGLPFAMAQSTCGNPYGFHAGHHAYGQTDEVAGEFVEDLAVTMPATTLGIPFDPNEAWDERKALYRISGEFVRTSNVTPSAIGSRRGIWTAVEAAADFVWRGDSAAGPRPSSGGGRSRDAKGWS